jgi:hypothetical protein
MSVGIEDLVARMLVPVAVLASLGLLRRYLPAHRTDPQRQLDSQGDVEDFTYANVAFYAGMIVVGIAFAFLSHKGLVWCNRQFAEADGPAVFRLLPQSAIWWFFPGFGTLCLSWEITLFFWSLFVGRGKVTRFSDWSSERVGYDCTRVLRWMALRIVLPVGVATLLALPIHSTLTDGEIIVGHYATLTRERLPYSQARHLMQVDGFRSRNGQFTQRAEVIIYFAGGTRWRSAENRDFASKPDPGLAEFLAKKTGLPLEHAQTEADFRVPSR